MISILVITYNHEKYIGQCLQSILDQEISYNLEINIIDDCSTDQTTEILKDFKKKYPNKINLFLNKENLGKKNIQLNVFKGLQTLQGKYFAIIEGDDYWSDNKKLQKQISFLENNSDFVGCGHNVVKLYEDNSKPPHRLNYWSERKEILEVEDCIMVRTFFHISSLVLRNIFKNNWPKFLSNKYACDLLYTPLFAQYGKIKYFDEDMGFYRAHETGSFSTRDTISMHIYEIEALRRYNKWLKYKYAPSYNSYILHRVNHLFKIAGQEKLRNLNLVEKIKYKFLLTLLQ